MQECQEPGCARPATTIWKGRKVCADCHDKYQDKWDQIYMSLDF